MSASAEVLYREEGPLAFLTLNRPAKLNALSPDVFRLLDAALARLEASSTAQVAILHGAGRAFAAGADIEHYVGLTLGEYSAFERLARVVYDRLAACPKPVIAAVQGYALGGGFELLLACDMVVAASNARMGLPEAKLGLLPGGGGTQRLPRLIGRVRANELLMSARFLGAEEALAWGLVNRVVAPEALLAEARALAESLLPQAPLALRMAKRLVAEGLEMPLAAALSYEQDATATLYVTHDAQEGIAAFVEKRQARFEGR
jgi:enoyl-CoA hydratase/carnithine racemase